MADPQEVLKSVNLLHPDGSVRNLRVLHHEGGMHSCFYKTAEKLAAEIVKRDEDCNVKAVYIQLQEIDPTTLRDLKKGDGVGRRHIKRYIWFALDIDTIRPDKAKSNATDEEKANSWQVVKAIHMYLRSCGWPIAIVADSGNGWHLLWRIELSHDPALGQNDPSYILVSNCLRALAGKFDNEAAEVDISLADPEQLIKLWGTEVRKSQVSTDERPWRKSALLKVSEPIEIVPRELLEKLAADAPKPVLAKPKRKMSKIREDFTAEGFVEFWDEKLREKGLPGWSIRREEVTKSDGRTYSPVDWCPTGCTCHSGDEMKSCIVVGDSVGWECFSDDCTGCGLTELLLALRKLTGYQGKGFPIFADEELDLTWECTGAGIDSVIELDEPKNDAKTAPAVGARIPEVVQEPVQEPIPQPAASQEKMITPREKFGDDTPEQLGEAVLGILLRDPEALYGNYALYRKRLLGRVKQIEDAGLRRALYYQHGYDAEFKKLPTKADLLDFITNHGRNNKDDANDKSLGIDYLNQLPEVDPALTLDTTIQRFFHKTDLRNEKKAWKSGYQILNTDEDISEARQVLRKTWSESLALGGDHGFQPGAIQEADHIAFLKEEMRKAVECTEDDRKFTTGCPTIDKSSLIIGLDNEHAICIYGPSNSGKTSVALSLAYNFAKTGKNGLIFVGEHQALKVEKRIAALHSALPQFREKFTIPPLTRWEGKGVKPTKEDLENVYTVLDDLQTMRSVPGYLEVKNVNSIGGTLDSVLGYLESTHRKYNWDFFIIDPFDSVVADSGDEKNNEWAAGKEAVKRLFDYTRDYQGGRGILALVTAQVTAKPAREIEKIQGDEDADPQELISVLTQYKQIQLFTTLGQVFDLAFGVALEKHGGRTGYLVPGRSREGCDFKCLKFFLDQNSWLAHERNTNTLKMHELDPEDIY